MVVVATAAGAVMSCARAAEVEAVNPEPVGAKCAVIECDPTASDDTASEDTDTGVVPTGPATAFAAPSCVAPSKNVTEPPPAIDPDAAATVVENVRLVPCTCEAPAGDTVGVVVAVATLTAVMDCASAPDVDPVKPEPDGVNCAVI